MTFNFYTVAAGVATDPDFVAGVWCRPRLVIAARKFITARPRPTLLVHTRPFHFPTPKNVAATKSHALSI